MENKKIQKKKFNFYKFTTFILVILIALFGAYYMLGSYSNSKFNQGRLVGQNEAVDYIVTSLNTQGYVTLTIGNESLSLVPSTSLQQSREQTILEIMNYIKKEGYVTLYNNETELVLVPYQEP